jgi:ABC-2 type transport system ATP-binding protein
VPSTDGQHAIETFSLTKIFTDWWGRNKVLAVDSLNLQVRYNEVFGFLGPNGSGKTTTIKMLLSLLHPTKGRAMVLGGEASDPKISTRVGYLPEESYLYKYLSARETLHFYANLFGLSTDVRKTRTEALLEMVGLGGVANRPVGTFSKGMARRIGLAQALINDPEVLILDEPTTGLDPIGTRQIKDLIILLAKRGKTILLCSHLLADVEDVCDRIAILYGGRMQTQGQVKELLEQPEKIQITTGRLSDGAIGKIKGVIESERQDCRIETPTDRLESFFIKIVTKAQQEDQPTSGAVSTTTIGGFLAEDVRAESILDKLVAEPEQTKPAEPVETQKVEPTKPVPNESVLRELTVSTEPVKIEPVEKKLEPKPEQKVNRSILDELTGNSGGNSSGDSNG